MNAENETTPPVPAGAPDPAGELGRAEDADVEVRVDRIAVDGTYVRVSSIGQPGDRAFVLVAGLGIAATYYERLAPHLNENGPVHALDLPGFAGVPRFRGAVSIERYADALERVIDDLRLVDPVLVGTARENLTDEQLAEAPESGSVFAVPTRVHARPAWPFAG